MIDIVLGGRRIGRAVAVDVGRIHYDLTRWVGTPGAAAAAGYAIAPADGELRAGDQVAVIGAAGPMGLMHVIRTVTSALPGLTLTAVDIDDARLAHLAAIAGPLAAARRIPAVFLNGRDHPDRSPGSATSRSWCRRRRSSPRPWTWRGRGARINIFAGFAAGTRAALDLDAVLAQGRLPLRHQRLRDRRT